MKPFTIIPPQSDLSLPVLEVHSMDGELHYHVAANTSADDHSKDGEGAEASHYEGTEAHGGYDEKDGGAFPPFDGSTFASQLLWLVICFGALYYIISKIAGPRIAGILETRRDRIAADMDTASRLNSEANEAQAAYEQALTSARNKAMSIASETRDSINAKIEAKRKEAEAEAQTKLDAAEVRINDMKTAALANVDQIATETADALVSTLLGENASADEISAAVAAAAKN